MDIRAMMKQAQKMQEQLQKDMEELRVEATSGGGMVTVVINGAKQLISLTIDPEVVSKDDVEMLQDLILAAVNDAHRKADEQLKKKVGDARIAPHPGRALADMERAETRDAELLSLFQFLGNHAGQRVDGLAGR